MTWVLGIPGLVLIVACPLWMAWHLGRNSHLLGDPAFLSRWASQKKCDGKSSKVWRGSLEIISQTTYSTHLSHISHTPRYGFLYEEYTEDMYAYETLVLLRKLAIACFLVFLSSNSIQNGLQVTSTPPSEPLSVLVT